MVGTVSGYAGVLLVSVVVGLIDAVFGAGGSDAWYPESQRTWSETVNGAHRICADGRQQSPIDFPTCPAAADRPEVTLTWANQAVELLNNGHTVQLTPQNAEGPSRGQMIVNVGGETKTYNLLQCHFHWGSEHSLAGQQQPLEIHCVHQEVSHSNVPRYGVLGIFFQLGAANGFLGRFENELPSHEVALRGRRLQAANGSDLFGNPVEAARRLAGSSNSSSFVGPLDFKEALTGLSLKKYWNYDGSFTTPPCTEAVDWYVLMAKATVSQAQLDKFRTAMGWTQAGGNFRNPQPLSGRTIYGCSKLPSAETDYPWYPYQTQHWAIDVSGANSICSHGTFQSPINFAQCLVPSSRTAPEITWAKQPVTLVNNGHAVQITAGNVGASRGKMVVNRKTYTIIQCHWHWSSEHTVGERQYPLEVHCVHQLDGTDEAPLYGVFGMFYEVSEKPNEFLSLIEDQLPQYSHRRLDASQKAHQQADGFDLFGHPMDSATGRRTAAGSIVSSFSGPLNFQDLYNGVDLDHFWNYEGSFTTPPCTQAVDFYIMMSPAKISQAQLDKFKLAIGWTEAGGNFRPPQPLAGRTVAGCRTVADSHASAAATKLKSRKCPNQNLTLILGAVTAALAVLVLAGLCLGPLQRKLGKSSTSSARQVKLTGEVSGQVQQLQEDLKFLEMDMAKFKDTNEANNREIAKMQDLVMQVYMQVLSAHDQPPFWHHATLSR